MKTLQLVFAAGSNATSTLTIANPKDGLTLDEVKAAVAKIQPIMVTRSGAEFTGFKKAVIVSTTEEELAFLPTNLPTPPHAQCHLVKKKSESTCHFDVCFFLAYFFSC